MSGVEMQQVGVAYRDGPVVSDATAQIDSGEWLGIIGPNGAGKSSLLKAIAGVTPHSGQIFVGDRSLRGLLGRRRAALVSYVPQEPLLPSDMSGFEYVLLGRSPHISYFGSESALDRSLVREVLERLDLAALADRYLAELSGGERQRMVIARALATQAPVLLLDEPTSALDIGHQQRVLELVADLRAEHHWTVVSAMHDLTLAGQYADRLMLMSQGHTVTIGPPADVLTADLLGEHYGVCVDVEVTADGTVNVMPRRGLRSSSD